MVRKIIHINKQKCNGCGLCVSACHEGAIGMVDGKAQLLRDDYCDGLGDCLPVCPTGAITFEEREAKAYDEEAVKAQMKAKAAASAPMPCGCPGSQAKSLAHDPAHATPSCLNQWPVQIKLVSPTAAYFENAHLLIAADCVAYAHGQFHTAYMANKITLIGCPKLDEGDYADKLTDILTLNNIRAVTVARMEVPCCGGIENAVKTAIKNAGKNIPLQVVVVSTGGKAIER